MTILAETWTVTIAWAWMYKFNEEDTGATYTFASLRGCEEWVSSQLEKTGDDRVLWYAIEGLQHIPCDESKPWGQTYQGMIYHTYKDVEDDRTFDCPEVELEDPSK